MDLPKETRLRDTVWAEVMKLYDEGEIDKLAEQYGVADMLCLGDEEAADKTEESTDAAEKMQILMRQLTQIC